MKHIILLLLLAIPPFTFSQTGTNGMNARGNSNNNEVTLIVNGDGATKEDATHAALRSAIEQAFGVFVSANTAILNDELVKDEIATISSGNIQSYSELGSYRLPNGNVNVTLQATVSIGKLVSYAKNKGSQCEFAGALFGANIKMLKLKYENAKKATENLIQYIREIGPTIFDKKIIAGEPKLRSGGYAEIKLYVVYKNNSNTLPFYQQVYTTILAIANKFNENERKQLEKLDRKKYPFIRLPDGHYMPTEIDNDSWSERYKPGILEELYYCSRPILSSNLGEIKKVTEENERTMRRYYYYGNESEIRYASAKEEILIRMNDYVALHTEAPEFKETRNWNLTRGFYSSSTVLEKKGRKTETHKVGVANICDEVRHKHYVYKDNAGVLRDREKNWSARDEIVVDGLYQVPMPVLVYTYETKVEELEKITNFYVN